MLDVALHNNTSKAQSEKKVRHIFIIGSKSIGQYGGYETFVDKLTEHHMSNPYLKYHIACKANGDGYMDENKLEGVDIILKNKDGSVAEFSYHNAHVFKIPCPNIGPAVAIYYDRAAVKYCIKYCKDNNIESPVFYILTCRIGLFIYNLVNEIKSIGGKYFLNPDGHEWMRAKWSAPVRKYWKWSEKRMVKTADVVICDSLNIEKYIKEQYNHPNTTFIAYGCDLRPSVLTDQDPTYTSWLKKNNLEPGKYYLVVGRFVPENNFETIIREFMLSNTNKKLAIITNKNEKFKSHLELLYHFSEDPRIKFVGTVYNQELLKKIRESAFAYIHGHSVGGTNPSLLEAMGYTNVNLLFDVSFNREVADESAFYWNMSEGNLSNLIRKTDMMNCGTVLDNGKKAKNRINAMYSWKDICGKYEALFLDGFL